MATEFYLLKKRDNYEPYLKLLEQYPPDDAKLAFRDLCRNDLFFLLVYGMDRTFADNDWFFARCREVQASPDWHIDLWFREGGKSLCITVAKTIQDILNDPEITVGIFSHTRAMAKSFLRVIKREFEINVKLKTAFDDILWADPQKESPKWSEDDGLIVKRSGNPPEPIDCEEPVFTITGWKRHGDLRVGDSVFGADGLPTKVIAVTQKWNDLPCYEVSFGNHSVVAAETHKWEALKRHQSRPMRKAGKLPEDISKIYTTKELKDEISKNKRNRPAVRVTLPLQLPEAMLPIDPYVLGVWLGDGSKDSARFIAETKDFPHLKYEMERAGHTVHIFETRKNAIAYQLDRRDKSKICRRGHDMDVVGRDGCGRCVECKKDTSQPYTINGLSWRLRKLGLYNNKHVPEIYLMASASQRLALLQGLMDTDGSCSRKDGQASFSNKNKLLSDAVFFLAASLGMKPNKKRRVWKYKGSPYVMWIVTFQAYLDMSPFRMERKTSLCIGVVGSPRRGRRVVTYVRKAKSRPVSCIQVDNKDGLYLVGKSFITTHNSTVEACGLVEGMPTGRHYQLRVYDDVLTQDVAASATQMQKVMDALDMSQNLGKVGGAARMIGTRYSLGDVYEQYIKRGQFKPRIKPATDNGLVDGNPVMFSRKVWEQKINTMSAAILASQMLQNPMASDSVIFQSDWFNLWPADKALPIFDAVYQCFDGATSAKQTADYSCLMTFGVWKAREGDAKHSCMVLDCFMEQWSYPDVRDEVLKQYQNKFGADERQVDGIIVEDKSSGSAMIPEFRRANMNVIAFNPGKLDKIARANLVSPVVRDGRVWLPESRNPKFKGRPMTWLSKWWEQIQYFPRSGNDDGVDVLVSFLLIMDRLGIIRGKALPPKESFWKKQIKTSSYG